VHMGGGPLHSRSVTPIVNNHSAAIWGGVAMRFINQILLGVAYRGQQSDIASRAHTPMNGGRSHPPHDDNFACSAKDIIDDISEQLVDDAKTWCSKLKCF